jgi:heavy metal sensor kinase
MFLRKDSFFNTVTFRLTVWYASIFGILSLILFVIIYISLASFLTGRVDQQLQNDIAELDALHHNLDIKKLEAELDTEAVSDDANGIFFRLLSPDQTELFSTNPKTWNKLNFQRVSLSRLTTEKPFFATLSIPGAEHKVRVIYKKLDDSYILQAGRGLRDNDELLERYGTIFAESMLSTMVCACIVGWFIAKRAMSGVERVTKTADNISKADFGLRVQPGKEGKEINDMINAFNNMLERIEQLLTEMKQITSNIAHDLRSPLTRIRGIAEVTLTGEQNNNQYQEMTANIIEECDRLIQLINTMLEIAETDSGVEKLVATNVNLTEIVRNACELFLPVADDKGLLIEMDIPPEPLITRGNREKLQRVIANLIDNAIKYTPQGGKVALKIERTSAHAKISVIDSGIGITQEELPHIFERFYRGDRSRSTPGNGLGLSLAQAVIRLHKGDIKVESAPDKGSKFTIILPLQTLD